MEIKMTKPTKEQFKEYVEIRNSGITNMFAVNYICSLSTTGLDKDRCYYIMTYFEELSKEYGVKI